MRKKSVLLLLSFASLSLLAADSPRLKLSWKNPSYTGGTFKNILVLALNGKAESRAEFEDQLVAAIGRPGERVEPSYAFMPRPDVTPIDMNDMRVLVREQRFDAIVVARLTRNENKTTYIPGQVYSPYLYYGTFYGYYGRVSPLIYSPGYMKAEKAVQVEVNIYSTTKPEGKLVWTGTTNTFDGRSAMKAIKGLVKLIAKEIEKQNLIGQSPQ